MEIKEFGKMLAAEIKDVLGDVYDIGFNEIVKNNGVVKNALTIRKEGEFVSPTIYIDSFFEEYRNGMMLMSIVSEIIKMYRCSVVPAAGLEMDFFRDFSEVSGRLYYKLVNYEKNRLVLKDVPYRRLLDLAMVPLCKVESDVIGNGNVTVTNTHLKMWEISEEELWENIKENAPKIAPVKIQGLPDVLQRITGCEDDLFPICGIYVVSNSADCLGAGSVFYPGVLKGIADDMECDLFIIPSSIHEVLVLPESECGIDVYHLRSIIHEVNTSTVSNEEILSDNLYIYRSESDSVFIADDEEEIAG